MNQVDISPGGGGGGEKGEGGNWYIKLMNSKTVRMKTPEVCVTA